MAADSSKETSWKKTQNHNKLRGEGMERILRIYTGLLSFSGLC